MNDTKKVTLDALISAMRIFINVPKVEDLIQQDIEKLVSKTLLSKAENGARPPVDVLTDYLGSDTEDRLKIIIGFSGGSLERLKRVFDAIYPNKRWRRINSDEETRRRIAAFLIDPKNEKVFIPEFIRRSFYLPKDWIKLLQDKDYLQAVVRNAMQSKYAVDNGHAIERSIVSELQNIGIDCQKGPVELVNNKEVDVAIPRNCIPADSYYVFLFTYYVVIPE